MKILLVVLMSVWLQVGFATETSAEVTLARKGVEAMVSLTFAYLGDRLVYDVNYFKGENNNFLFNVIVGTTRHPYMVHSCFLVQIDYEGLDFISKIEQHWDQECSSLSW